MSYDKEVLRSDILRTLREKDGPVPKSSIAKNLGIHSVTVTAVLEDMEKENIVFIDKLTPKYHLVGLQ